ncbi:MAG: hypothetical protein CSA97_02195 [Bacteroidetes bacterium]|nr:MAG: hypothetical protein CSA97_02195 [Bacteroidota bacterium]
MKRLVLLIVFVSGLVALGKGQSYSDSTIVLSTLTVSDGLAQSTVHDIHLDTYGQLWFATSGGLSRYDWEDFVTYQHLPDDTTSLANSYISGLCEGINGQTWITTRSGLSCFDPSTLQFTNYTIKYAGAKGQQIHCCSNPIYDKEGYVWVLNSQHLVKFDVNSGESKLFRLPDGNSACASQPSQQQLIQDIANNLWVVSRGKIHIFSPKDRSFIRPETTPYSITEKMMQGVVGIATTALGTIWLSDGRRLIELSADAGVELYPLPRQLQTKRITSLWTDRQGTPWLIIGGQLVHYKPKQKHWQLLKLYNAQGKIFLRPDSRGFFKQKGKYWLPLPMGIGYWEDRPYMFEPHLAEQHPMTPFTFRQVRGIYSPNDTSIWVGTFPFGLTRVNRIRGGNKTYRWKGDEIEGERQHVNLFRRLANGRLIGGTSSGFISYQSRTDSWGKSYLGASNPTIRKRLDALNISCLEELDDGALAIGTSDSLYYLSADRQNLEGFRPLGQLDVQSLALDPKGYLWVGSCAGLQRVKFQDTSIYTYHTAHGKGGEGNLAFPSLRIGKEGKIYVGTNVGLFSVDHSKQVLERVLDEGYFNRNSISSITMDDLGNLWIATDKSIAEYDPLERSYRVYSTPDGQPLKEFSPGSYFISKQGRIYLGGANGFISFNPKDKPKTDLGNYRIIISQCLAHSSKRSRMVPVQGTRTITMNPEDNSLTVYFSLLNDNPKHSVKYQAMLPKLSGRWIDIYSKNIITFTGLDEGEYTLHYRASMSEDVWIEGTPYTIIVKRSFLRSKLARMLALGMLGLVLIALFWAVISRNRSHREALAKHQENLALINQQNHTLVAQNQNIEASICYARRIQQSILPSRWNLENILPEYFLLFRPKNVLSGDFYWISHYHSTVYIAVIDCTGHGVPGAMMTIIAERYLRSIITSQQYQSAARILNELNELLLHRSSDEVGGGITEDAMDIGLCVVDTKHNMIDFSGGFFSLLHYNASGLHEYKGDSIFSGVNPGVTFTSRQLRYTPMDMFYLYSDGYTDQFGKDGQERFGQERFKGLIARMASLPTKAQSEILNSELENWMGLEEQVDDITVLGFRSQFTE